ncbi:putative F-box/LRR-repeat protein At5g02930 [Solanum dulcamara]|uniref:putative F-box/LRR-repeat protein At5g02930 n=1 Tax=Solanum dulcamara TaxID=45834 RepID=UPI002484F4CB|nr:putative F-box/LRR-repeat protein At5g02930 [Solanum dulcamara]
MEFTNLKKQKVTEEESLNDRISKFPDSLVLEILSLLPTKDAFRTCLISKRWQTLPTLIDSFNFTCLNSRAREDFSFLQNALAHSLSSKIKKLQLDFTGLWLLDCSFRPEYESLVSRCFSFAVERNVENVVLWFYNGDQCTFPESLYTCSSLITLDVRSCGFNNHAVISWNSLKSIKLGYLVLTDDDIVKLLSGCPALETMELYRYMGFSRLEINSPKLKILKLKDYRRFSENGDNLEILAPYLQHLEISGELDDLKCRLIDVSSVVNAKLIFNMRCIKDLPSFNEEDNCRNYHQVLYSVIQDNLQKLCHATELTMGTWFTETVVECKQYRIKNLYTKTTELITETCGLFCAFLQSSIQVFKSKFKQVPVSEFNCRYLKLVLHMKKFNLYGVSGLLRAMPHMETLNIDVETTLLDDFPFHFLDNSRCNFELVDLAKGDNVDLQSGVSSVEFHNLKKVKIVISSERCLKDHVKWGFNKIYNLSEFLLMNASVLEKFIIISKRRRCQTCSMNCLSQYLSRLADKLLGCPRSSANSVIIFRE